MNTIIARKVRKELTGGPAKYAFRSQQASPPAVTFYNKQVTKLNKAIYPKDYLTNQVIRAKHFIDKHFAENINLDHIAEEAFFSKFHFIRVFKCYYGTTPYQYLISIRIENAKKLLKTNSTVSEACFSVGFDSTTSFTALFRKITGSSPGTFQNKRKKKAIFKR